MKIGFDASMLGAATRCSGVGRYSAALLRHLERVDESNQYVLYAPADCERPQELSRRFEWQTLPRMNLGRASVIASYLFALPRRVAADHIEVFHAPTAHPRPSSPPLPRRLPCPLVVTLHDAIPLTHYHLGPAAMPARHRLYYRWNLRAAVNAARIITVSNAAKADLRAVLRIRQEQIATVYNGVDSVSTVAADTQNVLAPAMPYVLYVGSFEARKNLRGMLGAYAAARRRGLAQHLVVVAARGSGPQEDADALMASSDLSGNVTLLHDVSDGALRAIYARASLLVFPSHAEGFGLPPLESMAEGTPVIASDLPALREVLGDAAMFVRADDEDGIVVAMLRLACDDRLRDQLRRAGRARAAQFSWTECASRTLEVYREAATRGRQREQGGSAPNQTRALADAAGRRGQ